MRPTKIKLKDQNKQKKNYGIKVKQQNKIRDQIHNLTENLYN
jgi:hypothetical protein